jgi:hypothetical protein
MPSISLCVVILLVLLPASIAKAQTTTVITGARVIDGTGAPARVETVVISGNTLSTQPARPSCQVSSTSTLISTRLQPMPLTTSARA